MPRDVSNTVAASLTADELRALAAAADSLLEFAPDVAAEELRSARNKLYAFFGQEPR